MNLLKLKILVLVEKYKKVTDVANLLAIKQPTVTFHMKSLEEELGVSLYQTRSGRVWLSEAGKALYPYAQKMTSLYEEAERTLNTFKHNGSGLLRVGAEDFYSVPLLKAIKSLEGIYPELQIELRLAPEKELSAWFADEILDAVVLEQQTAAKAAGSFSRLFEDELVLICRREHNWSNGSAFTVEELAQEKFVAYEDSLFLPNAIMSWTSSHQIGLVNATKVSSFAAAKQAVRLGMGAAFATRISAGELEEEENKEIAVLPLPGALPNPSFHMGLLHREGEASAQHVQALLDQLVTANHWGI